MILLRCLDLLPDESSLKQAIETYLVAIDVTAQAIERLVNNQKECYSGKKKLHPIKMLIFACLLTRLVKAIRFSKGKVHDFKMYKNKDLSLVKT